MSAFVRVFVAAALFAQSASTVAFAAETWWGYTSGPRDWHDATSWEQEKRPGPSDTAYFYLGPSSTKVAFSADAQIDSLYLGHLGNVGVEFDLSGRTLTTNYVTLGEYLEESSAVASLLVRDGTIRCQTESRVNADSYLEIDDDGKFETPLFLSGSSDAAGFGRANTIVDGVLTAQELRATQGFSWIYVTSGGTLNTGTASLGSSYGVLSSFDPYSEIRVSGAGSAWISSGDIAVVGSLNGVDNHARLTIDSGGKVDCGGTVSTTALGQVYLSEGSTLETNSADFAAGTFVHWGGTLRIDGTPAGGSGPTPGRFAIHTDSLSIGASGGSPRIWFDHGAYDDGLETVNVGNSAGIGLMTISDGSSLTTTRGQVGSPQFAGEVYLYGAGSSWTNTGEVSVLGADSRGSLSKAYVLAGAELRTGTLTVAYPQAVELQAKGTVRATRLVGDFHLSDGTLNVGSMSGDLTQDGGLLEAGTPIGTTDLEKSYDLTDGGVQVELAGTQKSTQYDCLKVRGGLDLSAGGSYLKISLASGFVPQPGDRFDVLDAGSIIGTFSSVIRPSLANGNAWNFTKLYSTGEISVNYPPAVPAPSPATLECVDGKHFVLLATTVDDADGQDVDVTWKVDGHIVKTERLAPGSQTSYGADYAHGTHQVVLEANDGYQTTKASTTVTVQDTTAPILFVTPDVTAPTDPGKNFATGVVLQRPSAQDAAGHGVTVQGNPPSTYSAGTTDVIWTAIDAAGNVGTAIQKVIVQDREAPTINGASQIQLFCDPGKLFSTKKLPRPTVSDNVDEATKLVVTSDAKSRFPIGKTRVNFTATDRAGNAVTWPVDVIVVNRKPKANAGKNVVVTTTSEKGTKVVLDGSRSSDPDKHKLKYAWRAKKVKFAHAATAKPSGVFPVGQTTVTLTVTDAGGLKHKDAMTVTVKLKNGTHRPQGSDANESFAAAAQHAGHAAANGTRSEAALNGLAHAQAASAYGDAAGEAVRWEEGQSEDDALLSYTELRAAQRTYGQAAAHALLKAYAETGDENLLSAYGYAAYGTAYAAADLAER